MILNGLDEFSNYINNFLFRFEREFEECHLKHSSEFRKQIQFLKKYHHLLFLAFASIL